MILLQSSFEKCTPSSVLGTGLWGEVFDVGEDTVLKLSRRKCAGIGDGWIKVQREVEVLKAIEATGEHSELSIARVCGWGERSIQSPSTDNRELWLQMTKVLGKGRTVAELHSLREKEKSVVAISIATAIAEIHRLLRLSAGKLHLPTAEDSLLMIQDEVRDHPETKSGAKYIAQLLKAVKAIGCSSLDIIHGDFNISNILFCADSVSAVVDFAETRQGFWEEDIAAIVDELPSYQRRIIAAFELATGRSVSEQKLNYGLTLRALLTFLISCRLQPSQHHRKEKKQLEQRLQCLLDCL